MIDLKSDYHFSHQRQLDTSEQTVLLNKLTKAKKYCEWGSKSLNLFINIYWLYIFISFIGSTHIKPIYIELCFNLLLLAPALLGVIQSIIVPTSNSSRIFYSVIAVISIVVLIFGYFDNNTNLVKFIAWVTGTFAFIVRAIHASKYKSIVTSALTQNKDYLVNIYTPLATGGQSIEVLSNAGIVYEPTKALLTSWTVCDKQEQLNKHKPLTEQQLATLKKIPSIYKGFDCYHRQLSPSELEQLKQMHSNKHEQMLLAIKRLLIIWPIFTYYLVYQLIDYAFTLSITISLSTICMIYGSGLLTIYRAKKMLKKDIAQQVALYVFYLNDDIRTSDWERCYLPNSEVKWH